MGSMCILWNLPIICDSYIFSSATLSIFHGTTSMALIGKLSIIAKNWVGIGLFPGHAHGRLWFLSMSSNVSLKQQEQILFHKGEKPAQQQGRQGQELWGGAGALGWGRDFGVGQGGDPLLKLLAAELQGSPRLLKQLCFLRKLALSPSSSALRMMKCIFQIQHCASRYSQPQTGAIYLPWGASTP